jgi:hypothetical protein
VSKKSKPTGPSKAFQNKWGASPYHDYDVKLTHAAREAVREVYGTGPVIDGDASTTEDIIRFVCADNFVHHGKANDGEGYVMQASRTICMLPHDDDACVYVYLEHENKPGDCPNCRAIAESGPYDAEPAAKVH